MPPDRPEKARACIVESAKDLLAVGSYVAIDIPIGLADAAGEQRLADKAAKDFLKERAIDPLVRKGFPETRVFLSPTREHLSFFNSDPSKRGYWDLCETLPKGKRLSPVAWAICTKIVELDNLLSEKTDVPLYEVHPEVSFAACAGQTLAPKKSTRRKPSPGPEQRRSLLERIGFDLERLRHGLGRRTGRWASDDLYDACIALWSADRIAQGTHATLPDPPQRDSRGHRMAIHY
ncbi:Predicted nuclease (RNAse H fold) [Rhodovulum sp. ES.010]|nr:Predicted nuclease (RNAse H fold) [Rhodovulum sp. ES.010]